MSMKKINKVLVYLSSNKKKDRSPFLINLNLILTLLLLFRLIQQEVNLPHYFDYLLALT